jgi:aminoglycoside 3-N-acetyltransferase
VQSGRVYVTRNSLADDLRKLGVRPSHPILLHASLRSLGWVEGGAEAVVSALRDVVGPAGTLVAPATTSENSTTSPAYKHRTRGMTAGQRRRYRSCMSAFDPATTPGGGTGLIAEHIRTSADSVRSTHPQSSFAAVGADAGRLMHRHADECHLGEDSPLAALYEADAQILMIGVGYDSCTAFHLAEYRYTDRPPRRRYACVVMRDGRRQWWRYEDVVLDSSDFNDIGTALAATPHVIRGTVGSADATLIPMRAAVDFAAAWLAAHRGRSPKCITAQADTTVFP